MLVSLKWLQAYVETPRSAESLAERFRLTSSEVDTIHELGTSLTGLVVGKVLSVSEHPKSEILHVAEVSIGRETLSIVCGAPNLAQGQTVIVAPVGTTIYPVTGEPLTIGERAIRGVTSYGMLCAAEEIGINIPSDGIWVLPDHFSAGESFAEAAGLNDSVLDLEITPNRPDLLSYIGLAREVAAFDRIRLQEPALATQLDEGSFSVPAPHIEVLDRRLSSRYCAVTVEGNLTQPSPWWLQRALISVGQRPINLIVDCTNFCMRESNQPMHAFDLAKVDPQRITVRGARSGETITLLDASTRTLEEGDIVIAHGDEAPIALAGIMGGADTAISSTTTSALLESATFSGSAIRRTSRRLGLRSEASNRYEKGLDPELALTALKRLIYLLQQEDGVTVTSPLFDYYPQPEVERPRIHLTFARLFQITGMNIPPAECRAILQRLGFTVTSMSKSAIEVVAPSWRQDVRLPEDIIEEIIRIWGFERIPVNFPNGTVKPPVRNESFERGYMIRRTLAATGAQETIHLPFVSAQHLQAIGFPIIDAVSMAYPLSSDQAYLAPTRLIPLLTTVSSRFRTDSEQELFEISQKPLKSGEHRHQLSLMLRTAGSAETLLRRAKGMLDALNASLVLATPLTITPTVLGEEYAYYALGGACTIWYDGIAIGQVGLLAQSVIDTWKIRKSRTIIYADVDIEPLLAAAPAFPTISPESPYQSVERDITLDLAESTKTGSLLEAVQTSSLPDVARTVTIATVYRAAATPDRKAVTFHITYTPWQRTLTDAEVQADLEQLTQMLISTPNDYSNPR